MLNKTTLENINLIQPMLDKNLSIDFIAELMSENQVYSEGVNYWRNLMLKWIKSGDLRA